MARRDTLSQLLREFERISLGVILAACTATLLLVARSNLVPVQRPLTFGLAFGLSFLLLYAVIAWLPAVVLSAVFWWGHSLRWSRALVSAGLLAFVAIVAFANWRAVRAVFLLAGPGRFRWSAAIAVACAAAGLLLAALAPLAAGRMRTGLRLATLGALGATVLALMPASLPDTTLSSLPNAPSTGDPARRFLLIGLDGADWRYLDPLMARGDLPHLAALKKRGSFGPLRTAQPTLSPVVWTSVITGVEPGRHGIHGFFAERLHGVSGEIPRLRPPRRLGFELLESALRRQGAWAKGPVGSDVRRVPAYWNIAAAQGAPLFVVNWWATWPAERVPGALVTDRLYFERLAEGGQPAAGSALIHPESRARELNALVVLPADVPIERARRYFDVTSDEYERMRRRDAELKPTVLRELTYFVGSFESERRIALHLLRQPQAATAPDALVLFRLVDKMCHVALRYSELVDDHLGSRPEAVTRFARTVTQAYREADAAIGELSQAFGDGNVIVVSDHGFQLEHHPHADYLHDDAPDGVFLAAGPAFRPGRVDGLSIYDVLPLLLYLKGFPTAEDQPGRVPRMALDPGLLAAQPERRIASYGRRVAGQEARGQAAVDREVVDRLRALGYLHD